MGVAIGFHNIITPAVLDGATADVNFTEASEQSYLYFGRRDRLTSPVVEAYCAGMHASVVCRTREWWLEDGLWQRADISIGPTSFPLWFRITSRTGDTTFHTGIQNQPDDDKARIVVRGLLLPELPSLLGLQRWLLSGEVSNWAVEFDSQGRLRASELSELAHSVVARWGTRFGVFQHRTSQWLPRRRAFGAQQNFDLSHGAQITRRYFPGRSVDAASRAWRNIYGRKWSLLQFVDQRPFGYFDVHPRATELVGAPVSGTAVRNLPSESEAEWLVGLDWLNCAAHVNVADQTIGLADYWCRLWRTQIDITPEHLEVWTSSLEQPAQSIRYRIAAGERGPLGPLYIEYK
jgi:hypothetical protein